MINFERLDKLVSKKFAQGFLWGPRNIIISREKHGDAYYSALNRVDFASSCLNLVHDRNAIGFYWADDEPPVAPKYSEESIAELPEEFQNEAKRAWSHYKMRVHEHEDNLHYMELVQEALKNKNWKCAWALLDRRRDYQYEGFEIEKLQY